MIATANLRDKGVNEMSSALKRRFNFETVLPIADPDFETELVMQEVNKQFSWLDQDVTTPVDLVSMMVTVFHEMRSGRAQNGTQLKELSSVMSTAEAVNVVYSAGLQSVYMGEGVITADALASQFWGVVVKDNADDIKKVSHYCSTVGVERARKDKHWKGFVNAIGKLAP